MADVNFEIVLSEGLTQEDAAALLEALSDLEPILLDEVATFLQEEEQQAFDTQGASIGQPWAPLSPRTVAEKERHGFSDQPLVRYGRLASEIGQTVVLSGNTVSVGVNMDTIPYARPLQIGDPSRNLPGRVYVAITPEQVDDLQQRLAQFLASRTGISPSAVQFVQV